MCQAPITIQIKLMLFLALLVMRRLQLYLKRLLTLNEKRLHMYLLRKRPRAIGTTTISEILVIMPTRSIGKRLPKSNRVSRGVTTTANAVERAVMTILSGASLGSVRNVA